ncbi:MAG TPA: hypothetical protein VH396_13805 [Chitinophagaceae bacterium]|jgi:hypothetical protein
MKTLRFIPIVLCIPLLLARCSKDVNKSSLQPETRIPTPDLVFGKWNLVIEEDTTFYSEHLKASSWCFNNWFYNFKQNGILEISNSNIVDSFTYFFSDKERVNISWIGWPDNTYTDTVISLTETAYVFKRWANNPNNSKTKKVFYLSK